MNAQNCNAWGLGGPGHSRRDDWFLELVAEYMGEGMTQDDAEIAATNKIEEADEMAALDAGDAAFEREQERDW